MDGVELEKDFEWNQCQKIYTKSMKAFVQKYAEEDFLVIKWQRDCNSEESVNNFKNNT